MTTISEWALKTEQRLEAVVKTALQDMTEAMQTPTAKGGRMRVDTSFLRNSGGAALNVIPQTDGAAPYNQDATALVINRLQIGDTFFFGWSANYARARENRDFFMRAEIQNWQQYISNATAKVRR